MKKFDTLILNTQLMCIVIALVFISVSINNISKRTTQIEIQSEPLDCKKINKNYPAGKCRWALRVE